ncbi:MAG: EamA family transporter [Blastocatellia bacterium]|nr:EamA family transporter [Blastocatellia bacterium]
MAYLCIFLTIFLTAVGQLLLKHATNTRLGGSFPGLSMAGVQYLVHAFLDIYVIASFAAAFLASLTWIVAVSKLDLGFAYPFMSLGFVVVLLASAWLFREPLSLTRVVGVLIICLGVYLVSKS